MKFGSTAETMGTILVGDMNVHGASRLKFSDGTSPGDVAFCHGWEERLHMQTRRGNLLDLVLTDLGSTVKSKLAVGISDQVALSFVDVGVSGQEIESRGVFGVGQASWAAIRK